MRNLRTFGFQFTHADSSDIVLFVIDDDDANDADVEGHEIDGGDRGMGKGLAEVVTDLKVLNLRSML
jgi:hypothetical protein